MITVGKKGQVNLEKGLYVYVGSGRGSNGGAELINRVIRHLRLKKKPHWHIDYILNSPLVKIKKVCLIPSTLISECDLVEKILSLKGTRPILGLGSTDCKRNCPSHFIKVK